MANVSFTLNGTTVSVDSQGTLLTALRDHLRIPSVKDGCAPQGQCGCCTVWVDGDPRVSCVTPVQRVDGRVVTTIEGLSKGKKLHPMQEAFIKHDGFQCGYCTPGQIMSGIACIKEGHANSREEISEYMSGNICRCGAYHNIVDAITEVKEGGKEL